MTTAANDDGSGVYSVNWTGDQLSATTDEFGRKFANWTCWDYPIEKRRVGGHGPAGRTPACDLSQSQSRYEPPQDFVYLFEVTCTTFAKSYCQHGVWNYINNYFQK